MEQTSLPGTMQRVETELADKAVAQFFYSNGISFTAADTRVDSIYMAMIRAIKQAPASYVPPNQYKLAGSLLDTAYNDMLDKMKAYDPDGSIAEKFGISYTQDGWDSIDQLESALEDIGWSRAEGVPGKTRGSRIPSVFQHYVNAPL